MTLLLTPVAYSDVASGTSTVLTTGVALPVGSFLVAFVASSGGGSTLGLTDSKSNTWTQRQYSSNANSPSAVVAIYTTTLTTALTSTDTLTGTSTAGSGCGDIMLLRVTATGAISVSGGSTGTGNSATPGVTSFVPASADLVIAALCESSNTLQSSSTAGVGYTKLSGIDTPSRPRAVVGQYGTPGAATTASFTMAVSQQYATAAIRLTETAAAPSGFVTEFARFSPTVASATSKTVPVTAAVASGNFGVLAVDVPGATAVSTCTATDTKGNTWTARQHASNGPSNGQPWILTAPIATALTTSDTLTVTINVASNVWNVNGLAFSGITGYDQGIANNGTSSQTLDTTATGAGSQDSQLVVAAFAGGGTGVTMSSITPAGFNAVTPLATTGTIRNLWVIWGYVNSTSTRQVTAQMSDATSHAWAGVLVALNANAPAVGITAYAWIGGAWVACNKLQWDSGTSAWLP